MSFLRTYIHFVWSTKNRRPFMASKEIRSTMWQHIRENALKKEIYIDRVGGYAEHCHCLISPSVDQSMGQIMQLVKGESSFWFNQQGLIKEKLYWQDQFYAVTVSPELVPTVRNYIDKQEKHHSTEESRKALDAYLKKYGFQELSSES